MNWKVCAMFLHCLSYLKALNRNIFHCYTTREKLLICISIFQSHMKILLDYPNSFRGITTSALQLTYLRYNLKLYRYVQITWLLTIIYFAKYYKTFQVLHTLKNFNLHPCKLNHYSCDSCYSDGNPTLQIRNNSLMPETFFIKVKISWL